MRNGIAGKAQVNPLVWNLQGTDVSAAKTQQEVLELAELNYQIAKDVITVRGKEVEGYYAVVRTDTDDVYGVVGGRWKPLQNHDMFVFFDEVVELTHGQYHFAGSIRNGEIPWIIAKMPDSQKLYNDTWID
jgi:hypothetical protein